MTAEGKHGKAWSPSEIAELKSMVQRQMDRAEMAAQRTQEAVGAKLYKLGLARGLVSRPVKRQQRRRNAASFFLS